MARSALVEPNGRVAQFVGEGNEFPVHEDFKWVSAPDEAEVEWTYLGGQFAPPPDPPAPPAPEDTATQVRDLERALKAKGTLTDADIINAKKARL